jgi:predicted DCC family thiol-disulfide oxidoreductase YuxK
MKQEKVILYDSSCPLCTWYTGVFSRTGFLDEKGRQSFCTVEPELLNIIDHDRSRNEIPLINRATGEVLYGIDALLDVLGTRMPLLKTIGSIQWINWFIRGLYKFVSYNRRVIVAAANKPGTFDCTPDFNIPYRISFIVFALLLNTTLLVPLHEYVFIRSLFAHTGLLQLQLAHFALVLSNLAIAASLEKKKALEYLGQISMLALVAMLMTLPLVLLNYWIGFAALNNTALALILLFSCKEYSRRMKYAAPMDDNPLVMPLNICCLAIFLAYLIA